MACFSPIPAYRSHGGGITCSPTNGGFYDRHLEVACGQCIGCRIERRRQWAVRILHESMMHDENSFVTLTIDDKHLPDDRSLDVRHFQLFLKRYRKSSGPLRYFHCGEYGDQTDRPHYHAILFGTNFSQDRKIYSETKTNTLYQSEHLNSLWELGNCLIGDVSLQSARYVAGYINKKITGQRAEEHYQFIEPKTGEVFDRKPEYATMSRRPGIGSTYYERWWRQMYPRDEVVVGTKPQQPPKYYDEKYKLTHPEEFEKIEKKRKAKAIKYEHEKTYDRLRTRERVKILDAKRFAREPGGHS